MCTEAELSTSSPHLISNRDVGALASIFAFVDDSVLTVGRVGHSHTFRKLAVLQNNFRRERLSNRTEHVGN